MLEERRAYGTEVSWIYSGSIYLEGTESDEDGFVERRHDMYL